MKSVSYDFAARILTMDNKVNVSTKAICPPVGSEIYLYDTSIDQQYYLYDSYKWYKKCSSFRLIDGVSVLKETYHINIKSKRDSRYQRHVFTLKEGLKNFALVQYIGDESISALSSDDESWDECGKTTSGQLGITVKCYNEMEYTNNFRVYN